MKRLFLLLAFLTLLTGTVQAAGNTSAGFYTSYNLTTAGNTNTTYQLLHFTFQNTTGGQYPFINTTIFTESANVSPYYKYQNNTEEPLWGSGTGACSYWNAYGYQEGSSGSTSYFSLWLKVPSLPTGTNASQLILYGKPTYTGTIGSAAQYNETCVFQDVDVAFLHSKNAGAVTFGYNSNGYKANATASSIGATVNGTQNGYAHNTSGYTQKYIQSAETLNRTAGIILQQVTPRVVGGGSDYRTYDNPAGGYFYGSGVGCAGYNGTVWSATTAGANLKPNSNYSMVCMLNYSMGGAGTNAFSLFINGALNATTGGGTLTGGASFSEGLNVAATNYKGVIHSTLYVSTAELFQLKAEWVENVYDTSATYATSAYTTPPSTPADIYYPQNTTYYNGSTTTLSYALNSSTNGTSMLTFVTNNSVTTFIGYSTNATVYNRTLMAKNGFNTVSLTYYDGATNDTSSTVNYSIYNGFNFTVLNGTTSQTLSNVNIYVFNTTNNTKFLSSTTPYSIDTRSVPNSVAGESVTAAFEKLGYANQTLTLSSQNNSYYAYNVSLWRTQELRAQTIAGVNLTTFNITTTQSGNSTTYQTTNGSVYISLGSIPFGTVVFTVTGTGYNTTNFTFDVNSSSEINTTLVLVQAGVLMYAFDEATLTKRIYFGWSATNGTNTTNSYDSNLYSICYPYAGGCYYEDLSYKMLPTGTITLTFNNTVNGTYYPRSYYLTASATSSTQINAVLLNSTTGTIFATYCTVNSGNQAIANASLTFQILNGTSYITVAQGTTGSTGCTSLYLNSLTTYQVIASATGYNTGTFTAQPVSLQTITLSSTTTNLGFQISYGDEYDQILTKLQPYQTGLTGYAQIVNFTVYSYNSTLTNWGMECQYNGSTIYAVNVSGSPSGGSTTTNVSLSNKTSPTYFDCYGLFDRSGYNTTYVTRRFYIFSPNNTYVNTSASGLVGQINNGQFSSETLFVGAIVLTTIGTAGLTSAAAGVGAPLGAGIISLALLTGFAFLGWINAGWVILYAIVTLAFSYFNSRQF